MKFQFLSWIRNFIDVVFQGIFVYIYRAISGCFTLRTRWDSKMYFTCSLGGAKEQWSTFCAVGRSGPNPPDYSPATTPSLFYKTEVDNPIRLLYIFLYTKNFFTRLIQNYVLEIKKESFAKFVKIRFGAFL